MSKIIKNKIKYVLYIIICFTSLNTYTQSNEKWLLITDQSVIKYQAKHLLHQWEGVNNNIEGYLNINDNKINVSTDIADFDSGMSGRDSKTIKILNALEFPKVKFNSSNIIFTENNISFDGELDFSGVKINKKIDGNYYYENNKLFMNGSFSVILTDFKIKLPSLMFVKMDDLATISYNLVFKKVE